MRAHKHPSGRTEFLLTKKERRIRASEDLLDEIREVAVALRNLWKLLEPVTGPHMLAGDKVPVPAKFLIEKKIDRIEKRQKQMEAKLRRIK